MQSQPIEREARAILAGLGQLDAQYRNLLARARGERPARRLCTCRPCLMMWALRGLGVAGLAVDLYTAHRFGWV